MTNRWAFLCVFLILAALLQACSAPPVRTPDPPLEVLTVAVPPDLRPVQQVIEACAQEQPGVQVLIEEVAEATLPAGGAGLSLSLGKPDGFEGFSALLAEERLVIAVRENSPIQRLDTAELRSLFAGTAPVSRAVWVYPSDSRLSNLILNQALGGGPVTTLANVAPDPAAMQEALLDDPQAIGFLPAAWLAEGLRLVVLETGLEQNLRLPVLALADIEPEGPARTLTACLQSGTGQQLLQNIYP